MIRFNQFTKKEMRILQEIAEEETDQMKGARSWRIMDTGIYILSIIMFALAIRCFIFEPVRVEGSSMYPTLINREYMFVEKTAFWIHSPDRGNIVICYYPGYEKSCVKRVIGLPGDTIEIKNGAVIVNDIQLDESSYWNDMIINDFDKVTVPEKTLFVMGDNRNGSKDSRSENVGCIPYSKVVGRVRAVVFPFGRMRKITGVNYS